MKGFRPLEDRVLVRRIAAKRQGDSSFLIPQRKSRSKARSSRSGMACEMRRAASSRWR
jgi:co-chaperonin GroES (HSP10)